ncbi:MAG: LytTR family DNA-binding domain-containing protein [Eubacteriales bacterium]|nr:LytTR family DNA-binding domain-containing protein [Eubacteriales bacterium]
MFRIIICDDDRQFLKDYEEQLRDIARQNGIKSSIEGCSSCEKLLFEISDDPNAVDLIYMDLDFGDRMDGMRASQQLRRMGYVNDIVFLTKDREQVFDAFEVDPMYYIVKGSADREKNAAVFLKAAGRHRKKNREYLSLSCAGDNRNIPVDSILYFEVVRRIIEVHYDEQIFAFYSTIGKLENLLAEKGFQRIHRGYLVSLAHVAAIKGGKLTMDNGDVLPVGRTYSKELKERLGIAGRHAAQ